MKKARYILSALFVPTALLVGCAGLQSKPSVQAYKAGTYTATAYGNLSNITVEVTFTETAIKEVKVVSHHETPILYGR
jgi:fumarate reductase flavoprotein subunit